MLKKIFSFAMIFGFYCAFSVSAKAEGLELDIDQSITIEENQQGNISYNINVSNNSNQDLISAFEFNFPFSNINLTSVNGTDKYSLEGNNLKVDLWENPIDLNSSRRFIFQIVVSNIVEDNNGLKTLRLGEIKSASSISSYKLAIKYPQSWGQCSFSNRNFVSQDSPMILYDQNEDYLIQWGNSFFAKYVLEASKDIGGDFLLIPYIDSAQRQRFTGLGNVKEVYFDTYQNAYVQLHSSEIPTHLEALIKISAQDQDVATGLVLDGPGRNIDPVSYEQGQDSFESIQAYNKAKVFFILEQVREKYNLTDKKEIYDVIEKFEGNRYNLNQLVLLLLRQENIPCYLNIGWNLEESIAPGEYSYWISWHDGSSWKSLDPLHFLQKKSDNIQEINVNRVILYKFFSISNESFKKAENVISSNIHPKFSYEVDTNLFEQSDTQIEIKINFSDKKNFSKVNGQLVINNTSDYIIRLDKLLINNKDYSDFKTRGEYDLGILPQSYKTFDLDYYDKIINLFKENTLIDSELEYSINSDAFFASQTSQINNDKEIINTRTLKAFFLVVVAILGYIFVFDLLNSRFGIIRLMKYRFRRLVSRFREKYRV